jgi:hypothetical protein
MSASLAGCRAGFTLAGTGSRTRALPAGPCVDGSGLARDFFTQQAGRSSHVFGLLARYT